MRPAAAGARATTWVAAVLLVLSGCASSPAPEPPRGARPPPPAAAEPADPGRRAQVRMELAAAYFSRGQNETALEEVQRAIAVRPELPEAWNLRGLVHAAMGDVQPAEESFRRALQLAPRDGDTLQNYGWFLCQQRRFDEAQAQFQAALDQPRYREVLRTTLAQGVCQARAGRWAEAERTLSRAYELDPGNANTAFNLAEVLYRAGQFDRARFYIQRVNGVPQQSNAQTLWLAARIEQRRGDVGAAQALGRQLRERFPQSLEALQFERGRFDD